MKLLKEDFVKVSDFAPDAETTRIAIQSKDKNTWFSRDIPGQHVGKEDAVLIQLVLDMIATEIDPTGAIAQTQEKLKKTEEALAKAVEGFDKQEELAAKLQLVTLNTTAEISNLYDLIEPVYSHLGLKLDGEDEEGDEDEGKETHDTETEDGTVGSGSSAESTGGDNHGEE